MSAIIEIVESSGAAYAIAYGTGTNDNPESGEIVDIQLYARRDAAVALEPILREFERVWLEASSDAEITFTLSHRLS